ncbi:hypothetical protein MHYP_G00009640 [Metynnis hypsauchen]
MRSLGERRGGRGDSTLTGCQRAGCVISTEHHRLPLSSKRRSCFQRPFPLSDSPFLTLHLHSLNTQSRTFAGNKHKH